MKKHIIIDGIYNPNYSVDHRGNVYNLEGHKMTPSYTYDGYQRVRLQRGIPRKMYRVHRIVCETFYGVVEDKPVVNHINGVRDDNRLSNLEWCTTKYNNSIVPWEKKAGNVHRKVSQYSLEGTFIGTYRTLAEAQRSTGVRANNISRACKGITSSTGGFLWKYSERSETREEASH